MCFTPQRRALFRHLNFQKWSEPGVLCTFLTWKRALRHNGLHCFDISTSKSGLRPAAFNNFDWKCAWHHNCVHFFNISTSKIGLRPAVFNNFDWTCAWRHNGVHFFMSHLTTWLRTRRFSEPFFLLTLSPLWSSHCFSSPLWLFPPLLFHLSILSEVWFLNFHRRYIIHYVLSTYVLLLYLYFSIFLGIFSCSPAEGKYLVVIWVFRCHVWGGCARHLQALPTRGHPPKSFTQLGVSWMGVHQNWWFIRENPIEMDDLGVPPFLETNSLLLKIAIEIVELPIKNCDFP